MHTIHTYRTWYMYAGLYEYQMKAVQLGSSLAWRIVCNTFVLCVK